jgi:hypothetical protein
VNSSSAQTLLDAALEHAFQIADGLCEEVNANRIIVIAYSAPSAHRLRNGEVVFAFPPTAESFAAAERSADRCRQARLAIDAIVRVQEEMRVAAERMWALDDAQIVEPARWRRTWSEIVDAE